MLVDSDRLQAVLAELPQGQLIVGIDEVGRGPLIGDVVACAVAITVGCECDQASVNWLQMTDSKKLSEKRRERLSVTIQAESVWGIGRASSAEIDELNILQASLVAMRRAYEAVIEKIDAGAGCRPVIAIVDGRHAPPLDIPCYAVIKGDLYVRAVSAASIVAKVTRDAEMLQLDRDYPGYGLAQHKGYPTKMHLDALKKLGATPQHRRSFGPVKRVVESEPRVD